MSEYTKQERMFLEKLGIIKVPWLSGKSGNPFFEYAVISSDGGSVCHITQWSNDKKVRDFISKTPDIFLSLWEFVLMIYQQFVSHKPKSLLKHINRIQNLTGKTFDQVLEIWESCKE